MKDVKVNVDNVKECWEWYELYIEKFRKEHYSDVSYDEFVDWCENNLGECPSCGQIVWKDEQEHLLDELNTDQVCDDCIEENGYYE